jgi:hypothetical protein
MNKLICKKKEKILDFGTPGIIFLSGVAIHSTRLYSKA